MTDTPASPFMMVPREPTDVMIETAAKTLFEIQRLNTLSKGRGLPLGDKDFPEHKDYQRSVVKEVLMAGFAVVPSTQPVDEAALRLQERKILAEEFKARGLDPEGSLGFSSCWNAAIAAMSRLRASAPKDGGV